MKANQLATTCQGVAVTITAKYGMRADSRNIAELLGIKHRSFMKTIDRYQEKLAEVEQRTNPSNPFYHVRFEIARGKREQGGGTPERYALLTETQCYFIGTLSKNTARVVDFKARLVIAFAQAQKLQSVHDNEYSPFRHLCHDAARAMYQSASERGSGVAEHIYHANLERMINKAFNLQTGTRRTLPPNIKALIGSAYQIAQAAIEETLATGQDHRAAYREAKRRVNGLAELAAIANQPRGALQ